MNTYKKIVNFLRKKQEDRHLNLTGFFSSDVASRMVQALDENSFCHSDCTPLEALALRTAKAGNATYILITCLNSKGEHIAKAVSGNHEIINPSPEMVIQNSLLDELTNKKMASTNQCSELLNSAGLCDKKINHVTAVRISDYDNIAIGAVLGFTRTQEAPPSLLNALRFFAINISSELKHLLNKEKLEKKNRDLLRTEEELKLKNKLLDNLNKNISRAKQVVDESSRLKSAFLANLSHEIRTPMNVIMGFTELLSADNMSREQRRNYIDIIQQNGTRLLHIMDSLIDISRFQAKKIGKEQQSFHLNPIMQQLFNTYQPDIEITGKPLKLTLIPGAKDGQDLVLMDKEATYKILNHLLDNAVKFTASGHVHFGYEISEKHVLFFVEDTGIGLPKGKEKEIFELFRQGDLRLSRQYGGTGLGLAIAKKYITAMNGQIWCGNKEDSEQGAIFKFKIPCQRPEDISSDQNTEEGASSQQLLPINDEHIH